jgi:dephospho-CoA kinase
VKRIALTGGIATGKSHVLAQLARAGVPTLDSDDLAHAAVAVGSPGLSEVVTRFGPSVLAPDGGLDRRAMAALIFSDAQARRDLEAIVLPRVREATARWLASMDAQEHAFVVVAVPLLYEVGREKDYDAVIVTTCSLDAQRQRLMARSSISAAEAQQRIDAQLPQEEKVRRADYVIDTNGSLAATDAQVDALLARIRSGLGMRDSGSGS